MKTYQFNTNLKCSGCVNSITAPMQQILGIDAWKVDLTSAEKILTVNSAQGIDPEAVVNAFKDAGFEAQLLRQ